ncbi:methylmalonyl-CoA mutase subunit beta [Polaribacter dokdonensis]|uniref:Methylmalonyl-CoA mutase small subunit n=1 Tax=Polaribacter dokdonensis DSW-5 TaxID=1300348 RepID=A0A0M9CE62_9FLAO|nr:methylmalonyl-CoA mutase subunit beta [Polaribacter dokdonensis]KOY50623.1 Methylmalonyl-CoA mutase small subunit [Polaribacter dokdonensis DSW-5]SEE61849.1 heterodimeric methylmalonyl-CoA mutase small subunit [Polaribacter dokdonensis DSW-5]
MNNFLFDEFEPVSAATWKQKIQVDLKGADYNDTLLSKTNEGITIKPFYTKEDRSNTTIQLPKEGFNICQTIFIDDEKIANSLALDALKRGANTIQFKASKSFNPKPLLRDFPGKTILYFNLSFLDADFITELSEFCDDNNTFIQTDIIGNLAESGNWFINLKEDHNQLKQIVEKANNCITISADLYQNAGANCTQQLSYALAHTNEYLNHFGKDVASKISFNFAVGSNYFFEIAKLRAFRILWNSLLNEYDAPNQTAHIFTQPSLRNKTLYDYNVNMLRTTSECMSAILGGSNTICNVAYDEIYHKSNEFGERISRNQLLILQQESYFQEAQTFANGAYYIESITNQLAEKALALFKNIEKAGGFLKQLKEGTIQRKINESAAKEEDNFKANKTVLLGTNLQINTADKMKQNLELYPFVKQRNIKTLITPIVRKRLAETVEKERLENE